MVGRCFGDRRASGSSPCLRCLYKAGTDALPSASRRDGEILDPQTGLAELRRDFPFCCVLWRQQPSEERADDLPFGLSDEVQRGAVDRRSLASELFAKALEHLKVVGSVEVVLRYLGMDPRERLLITPLGLSYGDRLHRPELTDRVLAGYWLDASVDHTAKGIDAPRPTVSARHLVREVPWRDYRAIYEEFDQVARFAELTPADRHMFWVEQCQAGFPSRAAAKALGHPVDTEPSREWPVPIHALLGDAYYVDTNVVVRPAVGEFLGDFFDEGAGR